MSDKKYLITITVLMSVAVLLTVILVYLFIHSRSVTIPVTFGEPLVIEQTETIKKLVVPSLELPKFFNNIIDIPVGVETDEVSTLLFTGDVLTARTVNTKTVRANDFNWAWKKTADVLQSADLAIINLETPLVQHCPLRDDGMIFCGDPRHVQGLQFAGVDIVNFANNHAGNWDQDGVDQTVEIIETAGMKIAGVKKRGPVYATVNNIRYAFIGYNEVDQQVGINLSERDLIATEIIEAKQQADVIIVQFHWGNEYTYTPSSHQKELAYFAIDQGVDLVIGNHPHWYQPVEIYQDKVIMYSHGNFIFDQMWSRETREGIVGKYYFYQDKLIDVEFLPVLIEDFGQPRWLDGEEKESVLENLKKISTSLTNN